MSSLSSSSEYPVYVLPLYSKERAFLYESIRVYFFSPERRKAIYNAVVKALAEWMKQMGYKDAILIFESLMLDIGQVTASFPIEFAISDAIALLQQSGGNQPYRVVYLARGGIYRCCA